MATLLAGSALTASAQMLIGHRGSLWGVENTTDAFVSGAGAGYEGLECDIRCTADGKFVVSHDSNFKRLAGPETPIAEMTLEEVLQIQLHQEREGDEYDASPATLEEFLDICTDFDITPVIEIKKCWNIYSSNDNPDDCNYDGIPALMELIAGKGLTDRVVIISFMVHVLDNIHSRYPGVQLQFLTEEDWKPWEAWCKERNIGIDVYYPLATQELINAFQTAGLCVNAWTVDDPAEFKRLQSIGIDMITTNKLSK